MILRMRIPHPTHFFAAFAVFCLTLSGSMFLSSCARMGHPDGGWYDELPPKVVGASPAEGATQVTGRRIVINFDEYIKLDNPQQNVVVSPAQLEPPTIKVQGRRIIVELNDTLLPNTTYTIDFSDAISDLNEGNPMGNYTYTFSTGDGIDSLQMSGHVIDAFTLEPVQGIFVGVLKEESGERSEESKETWESVSADMPALQRVGRTDAEGRFSVKGIAPGRYRIMALADLDGDFRYSQAAEQVAFNTTVYTPTFGSAVRQDTLWRDSLHIRDIRRVGYTRYQPDDIVLRAFTATPDMRYFLKAERTEAERFTVYFTAPDSIAPVVEGMNFDSWDAFIVESSAGHDTITYWLRDSTLIKQDTLRLSLSYRASDSLGILQPKVDTLDVVSRRPFALREKDRQKEYERWQQQQRKKQQRGEAVEHVMPSQMLEPKYAYYPVMTPEQHVSINMPVPLARLDTAAIHLYAQQDSTWYRVEKRCIDKGRRQYEIRAAWTPNTMYSLEIDSAAFMDIYGRVNPAFKAGLKVPDASTYGSLFITLDGWDGKSVVAQLLNGQGNVIKEVAVRDGVAAFFYLNTGAYYLRAFVDDNGNGQWDTGNFTEGLQPELMCYYPRAINCRANWDIRERWNPTSVAANRQKPSELRKERKEERKSMTKRNQERARKLGIKEIPEKYTGFKAEQN